MKFFVYQIGDLNLFHQIGSGVTLDTSRKWEVPSETFSGVSSQKMFSPVTRSINQAAQIRVSGLVVQKDYLGVNEFISHLKYLGGRQNTPIICFRIEDSPNMAEPEINWLLAQGIITDVTDSHQYSSTESGAVAQDISFSLILTSDWMRLSPWEWEYRRDLTRQPSPNDPWNSPATPDTLFSHPYLMEHFTEGAYFYRWSLTDSEMLPSFWGLKYSEGVDGGVGSDFTNSGTHEIYSNPRYWSSDPRSLYAMTGLEPDGTLQIKVTRQTGNFYRDAITETSTLELPKLNNSLIELGYGGLQPSDIVYTGLIDPLPGYVLRGDTIIPVGTYWEYEGTYPGETGPGWNTISILGVKTPVYVAYLHEFRGL